MNNEENKSKPIAEESQQQNKVPSKEAIEIAARIMANRAMRELELKQQKTPNLKDNAE
jgi:4'-phosphopantetheinyl transferase EntD